jgi:hypothetical protein
LYIQQLTAWHPLHLAPPSTTKQHWVPQKSRKKSCALYKEKVNYEKLVPLDEIHQHRMHAQAEELLMPLLSEGMSSRKDRRNTVSMTYQVLSQIRCFPSRSAASIVS